jgi:hypothetical protein
VAVETTAGPVHYSTVGTATAWDSFSLPPNCWRTLHNPGPTEALALLLTAGDQRKHIDWCSTVHQAAAAQDLALDASGFVAAKRFVDRAQR